MPRHQSLTGQPKLQTPLLLDENKALRQFVEEVRREHGVGRVAQTDKGGFVAWRYNTGTGQIEVHDGKSWTAPNTAKAEAASAELKTYIEGSNSGLFLYPIQVPQLTVEGNIIVGGNVDGVDVSGLPASIAAKLPLAGGEMSGVIEIPLGLAATPSITPKDDLDTGIYSPGANEIAIATNTAQRLKVDDNGITVTSKIELPGSNGEIHFGDTGGVAVLYLESNMVGADKLASQFYSSDLSAGITATATFYAAATSGGAVNVLNTVTIKDGIITGWTQV